MKNEDITRECESVFEEIREIRRTLHRKPEIGNKEFETTKIITDCLSKWGISYEKLLETGVVATVEGTGEGKALAFRADIDALPIAEKTQVTFKSENAGMMHACGHDIHTAALLGTAKVLMQNRDKFGGKVKFIFQPDEELLGGAERLVEKGALQDVDCIFGMHVRPDIKEGNVEVKFGKSYAAADVFEIEVKGKSTHGAEPHKGVDAIVVACQIVSALQTVVSRRVSPTDSALISVCTFNGGTVCNQIADKAVFGGIIRSLGKETRFELRKQLREISEGIAKSMGAECEVRIRESYPGIVNENTMTQYILSCAADILGESMVRVSDTPLMTSEDFGFYLEKVPGSFFHVGCECESPLHSDSFNPKESAILTAMKVYVKAVFGAKENQNPA